MGSLPLVETVAPAGTAGRHRSFCRSCINRCALLVDVTDGKVVKVSGDRDDPMYGGFTCVKGRSQASYLYHPDRLLHSLKRNRHGDLVGVSVGDAMDEIAQRLMKVRRSYGPGAIAGYWGTMATGVLGGQRPFYAVMDLIGSDMVFDPRTIDKGGKQVAAAALGQWGAPAQGFDRPEVALLIGANPLVTYTGFPAGSPAVWLRRQQQRGMKLIVVDPRRSNLAGRADLHLRIKPGHDVELLAGLIRVILAERRTDSAFLDRHVTGLSELSAAVEPFNLQRVAQSTGLDADEIVDCARTFADANRGYTFAGTGPSMAGQGSLTEYLVLVLETICGHWVRAGETVRAAPTLVPTPVYRAQAESPRPLAARPLRVRSLTSTPVGMPTAALADEILLEGEGQVRALLSWSGNPVVAFPDQLKTIRALSDLELFVQLDPFLTQTARLADFVIAPTMPLEASAATVHLDTSTMMATGYGTAVSYANITSPKVEVPEGSDLIDEWRFFQGLYWRLRDQLAADGVELGVPPTFMRATDDSEMLDALTEGSRVHWRAIHSLGHGDLYPSDVVVGEAEPGWQGRLDVGNPVLLADLRGVAERGMPRASDDDQYPFRLLCRRLDYTYNTSCNVAATNRGLNHNWAYLHPSDLESLGVAAGDLVEVRSARAGIPAVVGEDSNCMPGTLSMSFAYGGGPESDSQVRLIGSSTARLVSTDDVFDPYIGQPRMSNVPVAITRLSEKDLSRFRTAATSS